MKRLLSFFVISAAFSCGLCASDSLPFPVNLGGQAAKDGTPFAKIGNPVAADAELSVDSKGDMIIVNVNMVNAKTNRSQVQLQLSFCSRAKPKRPSTKQWMGRSFLRGIMW